VNKYRFAGGIAIVKDYIFAAKQRQQGMFTHWQFANIQLNCSLPLVSFGHSRESVEL